MDTTAEAKKQMQQSFDHFEEALKRIRTGRASASVLDGVMVEVYGAKTPLNHIASVITLDAQTLQITPFDPSNLSKISSSIRDNKSLGLNPADDGKVVRIPIPPLTEERRKEIVKHVNQKAEDARVSLRNIRHDVLKSEQATEKAGDISKDDLKATEKDLNNLIDEFQKKIESAVKSKEIEVLTV